MNFLVFHVKQKTFLNVQNSTYSKTSNLNKAMFIIVLTRLGYSNSLRDTESEGNICLHGKY